MKELLITFSVEGGEAFLLALHHAAVEMARINRKLEARARRRKFAKAALPTVKYIALAVVGLAPYFAAKEYALAWRGYEAVGGEIFLLILPLALPWAWYRLEKMIRNNLVPKKLIFGNGPPTITIENGGTHNA